MSSTLAATKNASRTAYDCAAVRAAVYSWTKCDSFDYLAGDLVRGGTASFRARLGVELIKFAPSNVTQWLVNGTSPGSDIFLFARQAVPDAIIREDLKTNPNIQVVILGAGLDTSALRIGAERRDSGSVPGTFFEVDLPAMQQEKRRLVTGLLTNRSNLFESHIIYTPCSFGINELSTVLNKVGFNPTQPSIWVWSGVIHYLTDETVRATVAELKTLSGKGSKLFFDFISLEAYNDPRKYGFEKTKTRFDSFGEVMSFGFGKDTKDVQDWLKTQGINLIRHYTHHDMCQLYEQQTEKPAPSGGAAWSNLCIAEF